MTFPEFPPKSPLFDYYAPLAAPIGLVSIPHSGEDIPADFLPYLSGHEKAYKEDVDYQVNALVDIPALQTAGIGVLVAHVHRICVDLNRAEENCVLFWKDNTKGEKLVVKDPSTEVTDQFILRYHRPYFEILSAMIRELERMKKGAVSVVDLHSMPSAPTAYHMKQNPHQKTHRPDFCISDQHGKTCTPGFIAHYSNSLRAFGHEVSNNDPYIGGYVTTFVNTFRTNNIQIEVNRSIYMDEVRKELLPQAVEILKPRLTTSIIAAMKEFNS